MGGRRRGHWRTGLYDATSPRGKNIGFRSRPFHPYCARLRKAPMAMWKEFKAFLVKENVLALAIAVVVGGALNKLVTALVEDFIMPIVAATTPDPASWQTAVVPGPIPF